MATECIWQVFLFDVSFYLTFVPLCRDLLFGMSFYLTLLPLLEKFAILIEKCMQNNMLPVGESNPGLPRDRRGYLPLY